MTSIRAAVEHSLAGVQPVVDQEAVDIEAGQEGAVAPRKSGATRSCWEEGEEGEEEEDVDDEPAGLRRVETLVMSLASFGLEASEEPQQERGDADDEPLPKAFQRFVLAINFTAMLNYTINLPTAYKYAETLGANSWFAGASVAASILPLLLTVPLCSRCVRRNYRTVVMVQCVMGVLGNLQYSLAQPFDCKWMLLTGSATRMWLYGCTGQPLALHFINACVPKKARTNANSSVGNIKFLGMGLGPVAAAGLIFVNFSVSSVEFNTLTNSGWFCAALWTLLLLWCISLPEPERRYEQVAAPAPGSVESGASRVASTAATTGSIASKKSSVKKEPVAKMTREMCWCLLVIFVTSHSPALWESSTTLVTETYMGWSQLASSLAMGAIWIAAVLWGEVLRWLAKGRLSWVNEADISLYGLLGMAVSSALMYWYLPETPGAASQGVKYVNQGLYILGSMIYMTCANFARNYATAILMRAATAAGGNTRAVAAGWSAIWLASGRGVGAFLGMGLSGMPHSANTTGSLNTLWPVLTLAPFVMPELIHGLRKQ